LLLIKTFSIGRAIFVARKCISKGYYDMTEKTSAVIKFSPEARSAIFAFITENDINRPLRVDLNFTGCCDPSLCMRVDDAREGDIISEIEGLTFIISPETYELTGEITIAYVDEADRKGFVISSDKPVGEWEGFGVCEIKM